LTWKTGLRDRCRTMLTFPGYVASASEQSRESLRTSRVKPNRDSRGWCEAIVGELPQDVFDELALQLERIQPCKTRGGRIVLGFSANMTREPSAGLSPAGSDLSRYQLAEPMGDDRPATSQRAGDALY
jgi:hypothetical protein